MLGLGHFYFALTRSRELGIGVFWLELDLFPHASHSLILLFPLEKPRGHLDLYACSDSVAVFLGGFKSVK